MVRIRFKDYTFPCLFELWLTLTFSLVHVHTYYTCLDFTMVVGQYGILNFDNEV